MNKKGQYVPIILIIACSMLVLSVVGFYQHQQIKDYKVMNESYTNLKQVMYIETLEIDISKQLTEIYDNYALAGNYYDVSDNPTAIYYCEQTRKDIDSYSQELREIKAEIPEVTSKVMEKRKEMINTEIDYLFALYESCEYTESACRAYDAGNYPMGDVNIDGQNDAIDRHDKLVEDYFNLQAEYNILKKALVE